MTGRFARNCNILLDLDFALKEVIRLAGVVLLWWEEDSPIWEEKVRKNNLDLVRISRERGPSAYPTQELSVSAPELAFLFSAAIGKCCLGLLCPRPITRTVSKPNSPAQSLYYTLTSACHFRGVKICSIIAGPAGADGRCL